MGPLEEGLNPVSVFAASALFLQKQGPLSQSSLLTPGLLPHPQGKQAEWPLTPLCAPESPRSLPRAPSN